MKNVNLLAVVMFAVWLASVVASVKTGHGQGSFGFFNGV
jgi:hypothetical protein